MMHAYNILFSSYFRSEIASVLWMWWNDEMYYVEAYS